MNELVDTTEMYLRVIYDLEEEGTRPMRSRIVERLRHSGPTVSQTVARMERAGLLVVEEDRRLVLTRDGRDRATRVTRKHRLAELLLAGIVGLEWELVHHEACKLEHVMSDAVEKRLVVILPDPTVSPFGMPVPGLAELGHPSPAPSTGPLTRLSALGKAGGGTAQVARIEERLQLSTDWLATFRRIGLVPGGTVAAEASATDGHFAVRAARGRADLPKRVADAVLVDVA
ncbi:iron dependent repressor, metal binding and dimerization domain protein [Saccharothrix australiensis]|uniref:DtxR family iron (Metal) dependent repressor n=1 Tax=Saccharothrix australiensis TaxID=2072 RepID=A0A495W5R4_9PSEU|nr:iron dependent repressor, metal binding and dimerization domain protein [Saccharothrix australiensis]RKT55158.1 DtxR family iron (metal) dependent repressor [Saccharothrix australiensis]